MREAYRYTDTELKKILKSITVIVDTREQENSHITEWFDSKEIPYIKRALPQMDYSFFLPANPELGILKDIWFNKEIAIERKASLTELANNFTNERDRFEKEMTLAKAKKKYLLIENSNYQDILNGNYRSQYSSKSFGGTIHSFEHRYDLRIMYMPDKGRSGQWIYNTFYYYLRGELK